MKQRTQKKKKTESNLTFVKIKCVVHENTSYFQDTTYFSEDWPQFP